MRVVVCAIALVALVACASAVGGPRSGTRTESIRVVGGSGGVTQLSRMPTERPGVATLESAAGRVWAALPAVYESLSIPVAELDAAGRILGNPGVRLRRRLGPESLTRYLDCGSTQGGPNAETYEVHFAIFTQVEEREGGNAGVSTTIEATARPLNFAAEPVRCWSTGRLEATIVELLRAATAP